MSPETQRRSTLPWLVALALLGVAAPARADLGGATINFFKLMIHEGGQPLAQPSNATTATWHYFNLAHCVCAQAAAGTEQSFAYQLTLTGATTVHKPLDMWIGASCDDVVQRPLNCTQVPNTGINDIAALQVTPAAPEISLFQLMNPKKDATACTPQVLSSTIWLLSDTTGNGTLDNLGSKSVDTDSLPPPLPTNFVADGAEGAIQLSWKAPLDNATDLYYFQALCAKPDGTPALASPSESPQYVTARSLCGVSSDLTITPSDVTTSTAAQVDAGVATLPDGLAKLDPAYICGGNASATATSLRIGGLDNGTPYTVVLLAIDKYGNAAGTYFTTTLTPQPVTDFWEDLHDRNSQVQGGFCLMADTYGDGGPLTSALRAFRDDDLAGSRAGRWLIDAYYAHVAPLGALVRGSLPLRIVAGVILLPVVAVALLWHYLTLPGLLALLALAVIARRRTRHCRRPAWRLGPATLLVGLIGSVVGLLGTSTAHADSSLQPYWDDDLAKSADEVDDGVPEVDWHAGVRLGPYTPGIDAQLGGGKPGPYAQMFGGYSLLPMLDVDRVVWRPFGHQLAVGGTVGYLNKTAHAYVNGSLPTDPNRMRSPGDENTFRLIPFALTATYRLTYLDDQWGVPVVPYARAGLAYYAWWVKAPNGGNAFVCDGGSTGATCPHNEAAGASLGATGTIGLSIRGERLDAQATKSMRESGIAHAGFFVELSLAKVDGFGSSKKLSVGDSTWFGGLDFEF
jgi:hypothetical protein